MICEKCGTDNETIICPNCNNEIIKLGPYCYKCGHKLDVEITEEELDLSARILCSDGSCIGVINEQGFCKVCGKPYSSEE